MKICSFAKDGEQKHGLIENGVLYELEGDLFGDNLEAGKQIGSVEEVQLLPPVQPTKIVCVGRNYAAHAEEFGRDIPKEPGLFFKPPSSLIGHLQQIHIMPENGRVDHESELAVIIGKQGRFIPKEEVANYILGYTCANDISDRDFQSNDMQWVRGKGFDTFCSLGPWLVTDLDVTDLRVQCLVNGKVKQDSRTSLMIFGVPELVSYISRIMTLMPGDIILTGTPEGVGPIKVGDQVEVSVDGIGSLVNTVIDAPGA